MYSQYRIKDLTYALNILGINRLDVLMTGVTGAGKSTTLNMLLGNDYAKVGDGVDPETMLTDMYQFNDKLFLWDSPGLGDGVKKDKEHEKKLVNLLNKNYGDDHYQWIDLVVVIIEGSNRDMGTTYKLLNEVIIPHFPNDRILVAINQADMAMKGRHWDFECNCPDEVLINFLEEFSLSIMRRVKEATGVNILKPVYYSARYNYNANVFMDFILDHIPQKVNTVHDKFVAGERRN